jgi:molybdopterin converting factor small subunit
MNKDVEWLTVLAVEKQTKIPNATIRRYIRNHGHHLNVQKKGKSYLIASESIQIVLNIRKQYDDGMNLDQVEEALLQTGNPVTITVNADGQQMTVNVGEALQDINKTMHEQNKVIQSLVEHMQKQQEYIDTKLEERDRMLMTAIRENQESRKQVAATDQKKEIITSTEDKKWYQFWK